MTERIEIRPAELGDCEFVAGFASSLVEFGSPAWENAEDRAPAFCEALANAVRAQGAHSTVLIAQESDRTPLGFILLKVGADAAGIERAYRGSGCLRTGAAPGRRLGVDAGGRSGGTRAQIRGTQS
jgi:hypothetical protein